MIHLDNLTNSLETNGDNSLEYVKYVKQTLIESGFQAEVTQLEDSIAHRDFSHARQLLSKMKEGKT